MVNYLKAAKLWNCGMKTDIIEIVSSCKCQLAFPPTPNPVVGIVPPPNDAQTHLSLDIISLSGLNFLHIIDHATRWSEISHISRKELSVQISALRRVQLHTHGVPQTIQADQEYNKSLFLEFCQEYGITLIPVAENAHESNGLIERANRTLRSHYLRLRAYDQKTHTIDLVHEAVYAKNINRGGRIASSYELLYNRSPRLYGTRTPESSKIPSIPEYNAHICRARVNTMLRSQVREVQPLDIGESVYFWRDSDGWLGPATIITITDYNIELMHNGKIKTSSPNRVRSINLDTLDHEPDQIHSQSPHNDPSSQPLTSTNTLTPWDTDSQDWTDLPNNDLSQEPPILPDNDLSQEPTILGNNDLSQEPPIPPSHDLAQESPDLLNDDISSQPMNTSSHTSVARTNAIPTAESRSVLREGNEFLERTGVPATRLRSHNNSQFTHPSSFDELPSTFVTTPKNPITPQER